jgi:hypothetical protein
MLREYMLYIRNAGDAKAALPENEHFAFVKSCQVYIDQLKAEDRLIAAQPLIREGTIISKKESNWSVKALDATKEVQVGYYHIKAENITEAIAIAKENPEFRYVPSASIEVRPVKMREEKTNFIYPK